MHDWIFAFAFIGMVATPAMVAAIGGRKEFNPGTDPDPAAPPRFANPKISGTVPPPAAKPKTFTVKTPLAPVDLRTLPVHHARGLANR